MEKTLSSNHIIFNETVAVLTTQEKVDLQTGKAACSLYFLSMQQQLTNTKYKMVTKWVNVTGATWNETCEDVFQSSGFYKIIER